MSAKQSPFDDAHQALSQGFQASAGFIEFEQVLTPFRSQQLPTIHAPPAPRWPRAFERAWSISLWVKSIIAQIAQDLPVGSMAARGARSRGAARVSRFE